MAGNRLYRLARRIEGLPPYLFSAIDRKKQEVIRRGVDVIDLGVGDPDLPTPPQVVRGLQRASRNPRHHQYPSCEGMPTFRQAAADWITKRHGVSLDPSREILSLIGSKEGIGHFPMAFLNPGDIALIPDPAYPVYHAGTLFAGGRSYSMPLREENGFLPELSRIPRSVLRRARILFINYPNNPTAATADHSFFEEVVALARRHELIVCHDAAYTEIYYDGHQPVSFLEVKGAKRVGIEFHSLSKTFNMTGWRIGFAIGDARIVSALGKIKSNLDSGIFQAVQEAGIEALGSGVRLTDSVRKVYQGRRDYFVAGLRKLGLNVEPPRATFYVWVRVPKRTTSAKFAALLLSRAGILTTPGNGFGKGGEGFIRMTMTVQKTRLAEVLDRLERWL